MPTFQIAHLRCSTYWTWFFSSPFSEMSLVLLNNYSSGFGSCHHHIHNLPYFHGLDIHLMQQQHHQGGSNTDVGQTSQTAGMWWFILFELRTFIYIGALCFSNNNTRIRKKLLHQYFRTYTISSLEITSPALLELT
jgi:hypothetical protein